MRRPPLYTGLLVLGALLGGFVAGRVSVPPHWWYEWRTGTILRMDQRSDRIEYLAGTHWVPLGK